MPKQLCLNFYQIAGTTSMNALGSNVVAGLTPAGACCHFRHATTGTECHESLTTDRKVPQLLQQTIQLRRGELAAWRLLMASGDADLDAHNASIRANEEIRIMRRVASILSGLAVLFAFSTVRADGIDTYFTTFSASQCNHDGLTATGGGGLVNNSGSTKSVFCGIPVDHGWIANSSPVNQGIVDNASVIKTGDVSCTLRRLSPNGVNFLVNPDTVSLGSGYDEIRWSNSMFYKLANSVMLQCTVGSGASIQSYTAMVDFYDRHG